MLRAQDNILKKRQNQRDFVIQQLSDKSEVYVHKNYFYTYLRSQMGYGNECNIFSFPIDFEASLIVALILIESWKKEDP